MIEKLAQMNIKTPNAFSLGSGGSPDLTIQELLACLTGSDPVYSHLFICQCMTTRCKMIYPIPMIESSVISDCLILFNYLLI